MRVTIKYHQTPVVSSADYAAIRLLPVAHLHATIISRWWIITKQASGWHEEALGKIHRSMAVEWLDW